MAWESVQRLFHRTDIAFDQAIIVAALGLVVNGVSVLILGVRGHTHSHSAGDRRADPATHGHEHDHAHDHAAADTHVHRQDGTHHQDHATSHAAAHAGHHDDHNYRSAYLHVLADALTSVLALVALLSAKYLGAMWADPAVGILGAVLVARWSVGLLRASSQVLLDRQGPPALVEEIRRNIEARGGAQVSDLHLWSIGPGVYAAIIVISARAPQSPDAYRAMLPAGLGLAHVSIEVHGA